MTLPAITNKQQSILTLIYRFRFLNRIQIQTLLKHKYHKKIIDWLNDLTEKEYLSRIYSKNFHEKNKPAIYYLSLNGIRYLRDLNYPQDQLKKLNREKELSVNFVDKYVFIANICLDLQTKSNDKIRYAAATNSDINDPDYKFNFLSELDPDLVFVKQTKSMKKYYILELLEPTLPLYSIRKKIRNYFDFYFLNSWEDNIEADFPTVLFVCPTLSMLIYAKRYIKRLIAEDGTEVSPIQFTTIKAIKENGVTGGIWENVYLNK